ncbi:hypothetical protein SAMN05216188_11482 [Lentzea xinjiangensis]|uniref:Uncharacterized protein n=1 Tax=Lentzea xinjiangensis TaxID=402600 RepID=A0A1H9RER4_9PSEU|nr:ankyrin repeat domain-containing protein [Lentzea xinjiangensis]SER70479.1 hypothetical protein SAMN05216188_11482 [Lentzea xinjiangensis]
MGDGFTALHRAAAFGTAREVAELVAEVDDVDVLFDDRTALWQAVHRRNYDSVGVLLAAGADPARPMMSGWSPARLSLTTAHPIATGEVLTPRERAAVAERDRLVAALGRFPDVDGFSIACVRGVGSDEAVRRLDAEVVPDDEVPDLANPWDDPFGDDTEVVVGVTDVPGGCVVLQPWSYTASIPAITRALSAGTVTCGMYANPKSGNQGSIDRDGETVDRDLHPGGSPDSADSTADVLLKHLYVRHAVACCCAYAGLRPEDDRAFTSPARWVVLPDRVRWEL